MSIIDDFMSKVIDFNEKEKEETILFLANALVQGEPKAVVRSISPKVMFIVLPFLTNVAIDELSSKIGKGGEIFEV